LPRPVSIPAWLRNEEFAGIVLDGDQIALRAAEYGPTAVGPLTVILSQPFTPELLDIVGKGVGPVGVLLFQPENVSSLAPKNRSAVTVKTSAGSYAQSGTVRSAAL